MLIVALTQTKGGSGKSTLAQNVAVEAVREGKRVLLVDLDPSQSAAKWWRRRGGPENPMLAAEVKSLTLLLDEVARRADQPDVMVLDTPGELLSVIRASVEAAHVIVVPIAPSIKDWEAMDSVESIIVRANKRPQSLFVINRFRSNTEASIEARKALHQRTGAVPLTIALATDHERADAEGKAGCEISRKIGIETNLLWEEIKRIGRAHEQKTNVPAA